MTALAYERTLKVFAETRDELPLSATSCPSEIGATGVVTDGKRPIADIRVEQVEQSKAGRTSYSGLEVMKETQGKANPKQVNERLQRQLG